MTNVSKDKFSLAVSFDRIVKLFPRHVQSKEEGMELLRRWQEFTPNKEAEFFKTLDEANEFRAILGDPITSDEMLGLKRGILAIADYFEKHGVRFTAVHMRILAGNFQQQYPKELEKKKKKK